MERLTGQTLGQYQLRSLLGMGGMGAVYEGFQPSLQRLVAVKVLFSAADQQLDNYEQRFDREARMSARLEHPHIVPVYDYGIERGISFVAMRLLKGGTLAERIETGKSAPTGIALEPAVQITNALGSALFYAHQQGVIHRDIKATNVMFDDHGTVMIVDFGLAKLVDSATKLTVTGKLAGTPAYMAPEQWRGEPLTPAIDQYALAILVYEMLTGYRVFDGDSQYEMMQKHTQASPALLARWRGDLPEAMIPVLMRALRKDPKTRYPNVNVFAQVLSEAAQNAPKSSPPNVTAPPSPVAGDRQNTLILRDESGERRSHTRIPGWPVMVAVALIAAVIMAFSVLPGSPGGASAGNDIPGPTQTPNEVTLAPQTEPPAVIEAAATDRPSPTPTVLPTDTATVTPSPTQTMTFTVSPTLTSTPTDTATSTPTASPVVVAQLLCDQMDVNDDGIVNILDLRVIATAFGSKRGDINYDASYDYDNNDLVNESDLQLIVSQYDRSCS